MTTDKDTLEWAAQWILDSLKGETNERVIEFGKNMAMTLRAAALPSGEFSAPQGGGEPELSAGLPLCPFCGAGVQSTERREWFILKHRRKCFIAEYGDKSNPLIHAKLLEAWRTRVSQPADWLKDKQIDTAQPAGEPNEPCPPHSPSGKLWHEWFDRCGEHATIEVVNATATLVIEEKKLLTRAVLVEATKEQE